MLISMCVKCNSELQYLEFRRTGHWIANRAGRGFRMRTVSLTIMNVAGANLTCGCFNYINLHPERGGGYLLRYRAKRGQHRLQLAELE